MLKFADEIAKEIQERGGIEVPEGCYTGEAFEEWLYKEKDFIKKPKIIPASAGCMKMQKSRLFFRSK